MIFRLDYQCLEGQDRPMHLQPFRDAGWEYARQMSNLQFFRRAEVASENHEIFTDSGSKAEEYRRVLPLLVLISIVLGTQLTSSRYGRWPSLGLEVIRFLLFCVLMLLVYSLTASACVSAS